METVKAQCGKHSTVSGEWVAAVRCLPPRAPGSPCAHTHTHALVRRRSVSTLPPHAHAPTSAPHQPLHQPARRPVPLLLLTQVQLPPGTRGAARSRAGRCRGGVTYGCVRAHVTPWAEERGGTSVSSAPCAARPLPLCCPPLPPLHTLARTCARRLLARRLCLRGRWRLLLTAAGRPPCPCPCHKGRCRRPPRLPRLPLGGCLGRGQAGGLAPARRVGVGWVWGWG